MLDKTLVHCVGAFYKQIVLCNLLLLLLGITFIKAKFNWKIIFRSKKVRLLKW